MMVGGWTSPALSSFSVAAPSLESCFPASAWLALSFQTGWSNSQERTSFLQNYYQLPESHH